MSGYRGKVVLLDFDSTYPEYDPQRYTYNQELVKRMKGKPFALIGVVATTSRTKVKEYMDQGRLTWRSFWDVENPTGLTRAGFGGDTTFHRPHGPIARAWNIQGATIVLIDSKGVIRNKFIKYGPRYINPMWPRGEKLDKQIDQLVKEAQE